MSKINRREFMGGVAAATAAAFALAAKESAAGGIFKDAAIEKSAEITQEEVKQILAEALKEVAREKENQIHQENNMSTRVAGAGIATGAAAGSLAYKAFQGESPLIATAQSAMVGLIAAAGGATAERIHYDAENSEQTTPFYQNAIKISKSLEKLSGDIFSKNPKALEYFGATAEVVGSQELLKARAKIYFAKEFAKLENHTGDTETNHSNNSKPAKKARNKTK